MSEGRGPSGLEKPKIDMAPLGGGGGGFGASERFTGPDGRPWSKWMVPDIAEYNSITDGELRTLVAKVAKYSDPMVTDRFIHESYAKIEELLDAGKIGDADAALWGGRISDWAENLQETKRIKDAQALSEAQGIIGPHKAAEEFRDAEEYLKPTEVLGPGKEPRHWILLSEEEKRQTHVRSTLMIIGYKKGLAPGTKELYMDDMRELPVDLDKKAMKIIFKKEGVLPETSIYATTIGDPKFLAYESRWDTSLKTVFCSVLSKDPNVDKYKMDPVTARDLEQRRRLEEKRRKLKQFYSDEERRELRRALKKDYGDDILTAEFTIGSDNKVFEPKTYKGLEGLEKELREGTPDSFYRHADSWGTPIDRASFETLRKAIRFWLITKGRALLLSDQEKKDRERFFGNLEGQFSSDEEKAHYKKAVFKELCARARDAEQIGWNFAYDTNMLETFDSRAFRPPGTPRHPPSFFWSLHIWVPFHPQERVEAKVHRKVYPEIKITGNRGERKKVMSLTNLRREAAEVEAGEEFEILDKKFVDGKEWIKIKYDNIAGAEGWIKKEDYRVIPEPDLEAKEEWSVLGPVLIYNLSRGKFRDENGNFKLPDEFKVLPDSFIRGPLFKSVFEGGRGPSSTSPDVPVSRGESASFFSMLNNIGNKVLFRTDAAARADLFNLIQWDDMSDNAFVPFNFDEMRWADVVVNILKKGKEESKIGGHDFSEAVRNLRLSRRQRELLLLCYFGIDPKAPNIRPAGDIGFYRGRISGFLDRYPNYYLEK